MTYTGTTIQGKMNGQGKMTFENGDTYEGEFVDGYFQGTGTYTSKDGWTYEGQFVKGQADGHGKAHYARQHCVRRKLLSKGFIKVRIKWFSLVRIQDLF